MIPCLYAEAEMSFTTNGIGKLCDTISCSVTEKRNGSYELKMTYPSDGLHAETLSFWQNHLSGFPHSRFGSTRLRHR